VKRIVLLLVLAGAAAWQFAPSWLAGNVSAAEPRPMPKAAPEAQAPTPARQFADDAAALELKRQQLMEREAALKAKEEALNRLSAKLEAKVTELNAAKKAIEMSLENKKKVEAEKNKERYKKMLKIYKSLKAEEAGGLINKLEPKMAIDLLDQMDQKTVVKLIPYITQPRVLEWTRLNLAGK